MLLIANKEGYGYGWIDEVLGERDLRRIKDEVDRHRESSAAYGLPVRQLNATLWSAHSERTRIISAAYLMFTKALQPRSAIDPDLLGPYSLEKSSPERFEPAAVAGDPYGDDPPKPFARG